MSTKCKEREWDKYQLKTIFPHNTTFKFNGALTSDKNTQAAIEKYKQLRKKK